MTSGGRTSGVVVPATLRERVTGIWGAAGARWLDAVPGLVAGLARDWELEVGDPYPLSINWVAPARRADGTAVVLKLGVPAAGHLRREAAALTAFGGRGAVALLACDDARGALLLERAAPGRPAAALVPADDAAATAAIVAVARRLHRPAPPGTGLPELATRGAAFGAYLRAHPAGGPLAGELVRRADRLFAELVATATARVVLHGDLHHDNVLRAGREPWLAIDPHGLVGDPGYEVGALLYNPLGAADVVPLLPGRVRQLADGLGLPRERVVAWGFVQAVLAEVWAVEDGGRPDGRPTAVARALLARLPRSVSGEP